MAAKTLLVLSAAACLMKITTAQCLGNPGLSNLAADELLAANIAGKSLPYGPGYMGPYGPYPNVAPTSGGSFAVTSASPISPTGLTVASENAIEGAVAVSGQLPFLGAVALEGALPTAGAGSINYGCGNGNVAMISEGISPAVGPAYPGVGFAPGYAGGVGYGPGLGSGLGYGVY